MSLSSRPSTSQPASNNNSNISLVTLPMHQEHSIDPDDPDFAEEGDSRKFKNAIWGHFYYLSLATFQLFPITVKEPSTPKLLLYYLPNILSGIWLLSRTVYMFIRMISAISLTEIWAYTNCLFFFALHGFISSLLLALFKSQNYFEVTLRLLKIATRGRFTMKMSMCKVTIFRLFIFTSFFILTMAFYCAENIVLYPFLVVKLKEYGIPNNETQTFRDSMFGMQSLFFLDIIQIIWGAYLSTMCIAIYLCSNRALCEEYANFLKTIQSKAADKSLQKLESMEDVEAQLIDYLKLAKFISDNALVILSITFMKALVINITAEFCLISFSDYLSLGKITFILWIVLSVMMMIISIDKPSIFQSLINETIDTIYLDHGIWRECSDKNVKQVARNIVDRLHNFNYCSKGLSSAKAGVMGFNLIFVFIPFISAILSAYKVIPHYAIPH